MKEETVVRGRKKKLDPGGTADIGDTVLLRDGRTAEVVDCTWVQMVYGRLLNCGRLKVRFPDDHTEYLSVGTVRVLKRMEPGVR